MPVAFRQPGDPRKQRIPILTIPPERRIRFLGGPADHVQVYLHFVGSYSVPCLGDECEICQTPPILFGYAAVGEYIRPRNGNWIIKPAILPVTELCIEILEDDFRDRVLIVNRRRNNPNGAMEIRIESAGGSPGLPLFSVKERLTSLWASRSRDVMGGPKSVFMGEDQDGNDVVRYGT